jgi:hypothetical protein
MNALLTEAEQLWKDSEFAAAIANYDRALEMVCADASSLRIDLGGIGFKFVVSCRLAGMD